MKTRKIYLIGFVDVIEGRSINWVYDLKSVKANAESYPAHAILASHMRMLQPGVYPIPMTERWIEAP